MRKVKFDVELGGKVFANDEIWELQRLRKEAKELRKEEEALKRLELY